MPPGRRTASVVTLWLRTLPAHHDHRMWWRSSRNWPRAGTSAGVAESRALGLDPPP